MDSLGNEVFYGLDFGTTNSSLSILDSGKNKLLPIDSHTNKPEVARSALYFYPRTLKISNKVNKEQLSSNTFMHNQIWYEGEERMCVGSEAVSIYLKDNRNRHKGITRKIYTGKYNNVILYNTPSGKVITGDIPEYYEEIDFGTGRLFHALKTALKAPSFKGSRIFGKEYSLEEMISIFVANLKQEADQYTKRNVKRIVCGRPVQFSSNSAADKAAQDRLEKAIKLAGFDHVTFEFEPVAAAKYYLSKYPSSGKKVMVFDFGGGTFDTTIMEGIQDSKEKKFNILATDGVYIGGDLLNSDIFYHKLGHLFGSQTKFGDKQMSLPSHIIAGLQSWFGIPNLNNPSDINFLTETVRYKNSDIKTIDWLLHLIQKNLGFEMYEAIELAKKELTNNSSARIVFKDLPIDVDVEITRDEFEEIIKPRVLSVKNTVENTLKIANLNPSDIDVVVRTGGSSLIPVVENMLVQMFGKDKVVEFDPFTSVAGGLLI